VSTAVAIAIWLVFGYAFTFWFVNYFLDDRKWADSNEEIGPLYLVFLTLLGPPMAAVMLLLLLLDFVVEHFSESVKRFYGMRR